ncbi:MAG: HIT family protein [Candidatus Paceibacterota bacterium]
MSTLFSKIIAGEIPSYKIYEDEQIYAFLTIRPHTKGHTLVVLKIEVDHWDDVPEEYFNHMWRASQFVAKILKAKTGCARVAVMVVGFEVPHAHIHLIPSNSMEDLSIEKSYDATQEELEEMHTLLTS